MNADQSIYRCARLTLQAQSAHGVQSGRGDSTHDVLLVRDVNGLPALPGSSLAGVLRHAYSQAFGNEAADRLFGAFGNEGGMSSVSIGWAFIHDAENKAVEGLRQGIVDDALLGYLTREKPIIRQRVRLNHRGAGADGGKFDTTWVPAGARYTSLIGYWCDGTSESEMQWQRLLELISSHDLRLGHGTRAGAGQFSVQHFSYTSWDLRTPEGKSGYLKRARTRNAVLANIQSARKDASLQVSLSLKAESGWRIGGGEISLRSEHEGNRTPDLLPQHELSICWDNDKGKLAQQRHLLPGTAIKGALRHRVAFHYRCLQGEFSNTLPVDRFDAENCPAVTALFGSSSGDEGFGGLLYFEDVQISDAKLKTLMHNRIDRFTGGVMDGALFSEEVLWQTPINVRIRVSAGTQKDEIDQATRKALALTLDDLNRGWLPLGASGSRGLGVFTGTGDGPVWSDGGKWISDSGSQESVR